MKRNIGKRISARLKMINEDMREMQRLMRRQSVYAKASIRNFERKPKHPKCTSYYDNKGVF